MCTDHLGSLLQPHQLLQSKDVQASVLLACFEVCCKSSMRQLTHTFKTEDLTCLACQIFSVSSWPTWLFPCCLPTKLCFPRMRTYETHYSKTPPQTSAVCVIRGLVRNTDVCILPDLPGVRSAF